MNPTFIQPHERYIYEGTGAKGTVSIIGWMGLGDTICALPALYELAKTKQVTLYTERPELFRDPIRTVQIDKKHHRCIDGRVLDPLFDIEELKHCERMYKIDGDLIWKWPASFDDVSAQQRMALALGVEIGAFDYAAALGAKKLDREPFKVFAPVSTDVKRSLPFDDARDIFRALPPSYELVSEKKGWFTRTLSELIDLVYSAEHVLSVDTGVAHIAGALQTPLTVIGGHSDAKGYYKHYGGSVNVIQKQCVCGNRAGAKRCTHATVEDVLGSII